MNSHPGGGILLSTAGVIQVTISNRDDEYFVIRNHYLHEGDSNTFDHALLSTGQIGLACLLVFQIIFKQKFNNLSLHDTIEWLKQEMLW
jgi:hypothetical protein